MKKNGASNKNNKLIDWDKVTKNINEVYPDGKLPKRVLKAAGWKSNKEHDEWFEKVVIPQTKAMLRTTAGRRELRKAGLIK